MNEKSRARIIGGNATPTLYTIPRSKFGEQWHYHTNNRVTFTKTYANSQKSLEHTGTPIQATVPQLQPFSKILLNQKWQLQDHDFRTSLSYHASAHATFICTFAAQNHQQIQTQYSAQPTTTESSVSSATPLFLIMLTLITGILFGAWLTHSFL